MHCRLAFALLFVFVSLYSERTVKNARGQESLRTTIRVPSYPSLSPDGKRLVFSWHGDLWEASAQGGSAQPLTRHPARDTEPVFSPDGKSLAFVSDRTGSRQVYVMPARGGQARPITSHTEGFALMGWYPDSRNLLTVNRRDHHWLHAYRLWKIDEDLRSADQLVFNAQVGRASVAPDGQRILYSREGVAWWRKGYQGSQASQIWLYNPNDKKQPHQLICNDPGGCRYPIWHPDGKRFFYVGPHQGAFNVWEYTLKTKERRPLTFFQDDSVVLPALSADGSAMVFRHLFDVYYLPLTGKKKSPTKLDLYHQEDVLQEKVIRKSLNRASEVSFSGDGLEVAFISGGDVWVMDTQLREPQQITSSPEEERDVAFAPDGKSIFFVSDHGGQTDIWKAEKKDDKKYWWENTSFTLTQMTDDPQPEKNLQFHPGGFVLAFVQGSGNLVTMTADGKARRTVLPGWDEPDYQWSPDGKWFAFARYDDDFNHDVFIISSDGKGKPYNVSRHPDNDYNPTWSPDGRTLAFRGKRDHEEMDIYYVYLRKEDADRASRDRKLKAARDKMNKSRVKKSSSSSSSSGSSSSGGSYPEVKIDFDGLAQRLNRISVANSYEMGLVWSSDSKKLAFSATINGKKGTYTVSPPENTKPILLSTATGKQIQWLKKSPNLVWLSGGIPGSMLTTGSAAGRVTNYYFSCRQEVNRADYYQAGWRQAWRTMGQRWYDPKMNNRNWAAIGRKYEQAAAQAPDLYTLSLVINLMLGELNGSHLGFRSTEPFVYKPPGGWSDTTAHLGLFFDRDHKGEGWKIKSVLKDGPTDRADFNLKTGEIIFSVDGKDVDPGLAVGVVLNGPLDRDVVLRVGPSKDKQRTLVVRPINFSAARNLMYEEWVESNREQVEKNSKSDLAYVHVRGMNTSSFRRFEEELFSVAAGKKGLVIDVRNNGGGFTTDHLLTILTQPRHAITVPRGGGPGYPQDRKIYASWSKPIVVLCNQNSFSNAEIFCHAIKNLNRGKVVGVTTAGGVISTGSLNIRDIGRLRIPFRGWYLPNGQDMEMNGAKPDVEIWPRPGELAKGIDKQLQKAISLLQQDVKKAEAKPKPKLIPASALRLKNAKPMP